ncbi:MAG: glycoside hydrolase family 3 C-terminal domain-containing protein, partial [Anaerolineae bacterium]|nr:glycoside hydrolase family 3 C-terminal domain-containing protein [Anaerolineae bacterium]
RRDRTQKVIDAVNAGELDAAVLDDAVRRILMIVFEAQKTPKGDTTIDVDQHHALAREIAGEALVLLKNDAALLPLSNVKSLAVIGLAAQEARFQGGGSSHVNPTRVDVPFVELQKLAGDVELNYALGYTMEDELRQDLIDDAVALAAAAEVALLYIGLPDWKETEGIDRPDMLLTNQQIALIKAVAATSAKTVVILNTGGVVTMSDWVGDVEAVLQAWFTGQAGGGAIADVLCGVVNPSGRLAETIPYRLQDTPAYLNYPGENGVVRYGEGIFIGYRYYEAKDAPVQFPFGYGLSYTTFEYSNLTLDAAQITDTDNLTLTVDVTNTGTRAGKTVVQVYVHDRASTLARPVKELKGFAKVALEPGETKTVQFTLPPRAFQFYDPAYAMWRAETGAFDILVGESSADIRLATIIELEATQLLPCLLDYNSTVEAWMKDPRGRVVLDKFMNQFKAQMPQGVQDTWDHALLMPLRVLVGFFGGDGALGASPDVMVDDLLAQAHALEL